MAGVFFVGWFWTNLKRMGNWRNASEKKTRPNGGISDWGLLIADFGFRIWDFRLGHPAPGTRNPTQHIDIEQQDTDNDKQSVDSIQQHIDNDKQSVDSVQQDTDSDKQSVDNEQQDTDNDK